MAVTFRIDISGSTDLTVEQIWPDGDAPPNPCARDVVTAMENFGGVPSVIRDWNLFQKVTVTSVIESAPVIAYDAKPLDAKDGEG